MTKPDNKSKPTPADRLHAIMSGMKNEESPVSRLPKAKPAEGKLVSEAAPVQSPPPTAPKAESVKRGLQFLPAFWTIASIISLAVNLILVAVLLGALHGLDVSGLWTNGHRLGGRTLFQFREDGCGSYQDHHSCANQHPIKHVHSRTNHHEHFAG